MEAVKKFGKAFKEAVKEEAETLREQLDDAKSELEQGLLTNRSVDFSINLGKPADQIISVAKSEYYEVTTNEGYEVEKNKHYEVDINLPAFKLPSFNLLASSPSPSQLEYSSPSQTEKSEHYEVEKNKHYEVDINLPAFKLPSSNSTVSSPSPAQLEYSPSQTEKSVHYEVENNKHYEVGINLPAFKLPSFNLPTSSPSPSQMEKSENYEVEKSKHYEVGINLPAFKLPSLKLPVSSPSPSLLESSSSQLQIENEAKYLRDKSIEELRELYLEKLYHEKQGTCEFYCPNCKVSITKVLVQETDPQEITSPIPPPDDESLTCTSCFSFLIPIGWFFSKERTSPDPIPHPVSDRPEPKPPCPPSRGHSKTWEIVKSIVYGGLAESVTSLGIVTSAASGDASTLNIVALALANLLGGLFVIGHNIWELKCDQSKVSPTGDTDTEEQELEKYEFILGKKDHFILHAFFAIFSFLVFGLVPPVVYGFTFRESNDKDFKLAAVAAASLLCITILSFAKAYTQKPCSYIKTVTYYIVVGFVVSGASYLAGELFHRLMKQLNWFEPTPTHVTLPLADMGIGKGAWQFY